MVPVKGGEKAPRFETLAGGRAVRVSFPGGPAGGRTDTIILQPGPGQVQVGGQAIAAASAVVLQHSGLQEVVDLTAK